MKKRLPHLPVFIATWLIGAFIYAIVFHTIEALRLPNWPFYFPFFCLFFYFIEKMSQFGPEKQEIKAFQAISNVPIRARIFFWISTISISILSILEGFFLPSVNPYIGFLLMILSLLMWIGVYWISLRNKLLNEKNKQEADQTK